MSHQQTIDKATVTYDQAVKRHAHELHSAALHFEVIELISARYNGKIQVIAPIILLEFKD
jgi:hypothetical protein